MFKHVHHVHNVVQSRDEMVEYLTINIDRASSQGMFLQLAEGVRNRTKADPRIVWVAAND